MRWPNQTILDLEYSSLEKVKENVYQLEFSTSKNKSFDCMVQVDQNPTLFTYSPSDVTSRNEISYFKTGEMQLQLSISVK